ncbi:MAG: hypothetical protein QOJ70_600 [Acidobacteriota bacterium]|jgi:hypothetical protein|nr:hypothetical protein [Acidobacteriota bacterium]
MEGVRTVAGAHVDVTTNAVGADSLGAAREAGVSAGDTAAASCPECGETLAGHYCYLCGEKRLESRDLSVHHFFDEAAQELMSVEHSKLFHTIWALVFRPGFLTNEWIAGRRKRYLKPLNLCLGILALSLFAYSVYKPVSMYDIEKFINQSKREDTIQLFDRFAAKKHIETEALFDRLNEKWQRFMSFSPLFFVGGFALVLQLVFIFSRRYFVEHLVFSMHYVSFSTMVLVLLWPVYFFIGIKPGGVNVLIAVVKWLVDIVYMFFAVRAVYRLGSVRTLLASLLLVVGYFLSYLLVLIGALVLAIVNVAKS